MRFSLIKFPLIALAALLLAAPFASPVHAQDVGTQYDDIMDQGLIFANICTGSGDPCDCRDTGDCSVEDVLQVIVNVSILILGTSGSVAILVFVYAGFKMMLAQGEPAKFNEGKQAMIYTLIGLTIIFGSYAAINFIIGVLKTGEVPTTELEDTIGGDTGDIIDTVNQ